MNYHAGRKHTLLVNFVSVFKGVLFCVASCRVVLCFDFFGPDTYLLTLYITLLHRSYLPSYLPTYLPMLGRVLFFFSVLFWNRTGGLPELVRHAPSLLQDKGSSRDLDKGHPSRPSRHRSDREPGRRGLPVLSSHGRDRARSWLERGHQGVRTGVTKGNLS